MHGSQTHKNFYIRPTTSGNTKGGFSVECRGLLSQRDSQKPNNFKSNNNKDNLHLQVNSYGFRRLTSQENHINNNNYLIEQDALRTISSRSSKLSPIADTEQRLFSSQAQIYSNNNNNISSYSNNFTRNSSKQLYEQQHNNHLKTTLNPSSQHNFDSAKKLYSQKYRNTKKQFQDQFQNRPLADCIQIEKITSFGGINGQINSYSSIQYQELISQQKQQQIQRNNEKGMFEVDLSDVHESNYRQQGQKQESSQTGDRKDNNSQENEEEEQEEQLSEINVRDGYNFEDSFDDIQQLATNGFEFHNQRNKQSSGVVAVVRRQFGKRDEHTESKNFNTQLFLSASESAEQLTFSRTMPSEKRLSTQTYHLTNSKQSDETAASSNNAKTPSKRDYKQNSYKENNHFQLINIKQNSSTPHLPQAGLNIRPPTTNNNMSRVKTTQSKQKDLNLKPQLNFYELFAGHSQGTIKSSKIAFFHNFYKTQQIKKADSDRSAPSTTFSVKKAQLFEIPIKQSTLMSRQGQRNSVMSQKQDYQQSMQQRGDFIQC